MDNFLIHSLVAVVIASLQEATTFPKKILFSLITFYIGPYTPRAVLICEKKIQRFILKNISTKNEKSMKNPSHIL